MSKRATRYVSDLDEFELKLPEDPPKLYRTEYGKPEWSSGGTFIMSGERRLRITVPEKVAEDYESARQEYQKMLRKLVKSIKWDD